MATRNDKGKKMKFVTLVLAAAVGASLMTNEAADAKIFVVNWSGSMSRYRNSAQATGTFDINLAIYPDIGGIQNQYPVGPDFKVISMNVRGALSGNGTFTQADFTSFRFASNIPLNYNAELIGQPEGNGLIFGGLVLGQGVPSGDFNLFSSNASAPTATDYFELTLSSHETLSVISIAPGVPEPALWSLMVAGFGLIGIATRRRTSVVTA